MLLISACTILIDKTQGSLRFQENESAKTRGNQRFRRFSKNIVVKN